MSIRGRRCEGGKGGARSPWKGEENKCRGKPLSGSGAHTFKAEREQAEKHEDNEELVIKAAKIP